MKNPASEVLKAASIRRLALRRPALAPLFESSPRSFSSHAVVPVTTGKMSTASGKRAQIIAEYVQYIEQLGDSEAGRLQASEGEPITTVRRRLGAAARQLEKSLTIRRTGDEIYFWAEEPRRRGRGRPKAG